MEGMSPLPISLPKDLHFTMHAGIVNFWVNLAAVRDAQIAGKTNLGVSVRTFLEEISIWLSWPSKETRIIQSIEGPKETKTGNSLSFLELGSPFSPALRHGSSCFLGPLDSRAYSSSPAFSGLQSHTGLAWFLGLWTQMKLYHQLSWVSSLQKAAVGLISLPNHVSQFS